MPRMASRLVRIAPIAQWLVMRTRGARGARRKCQQQEDERTMGVRHDAWVARARSKFEKIVCSAEIQPIDQARHTISTLRMQPGDKTAQARVQQELDPARFGRRSWTQAMRPFRIDIMC